MPECRPLSAWGGGNDLNPTRALLSVRASSRPSVIQGLGPARLCPGVPRPREKPSSTCLLGYTWSAERRPGCKHSSKNEVPSLVPDGGLPGRWGLLNAWEVQEEGWGPH